jgi:hypothetical protein
VSYRGHEDDQVVLENYDGQDYRYLRVVFNFNHDVECISEVRSGVNTQIKPSAINKRAPADRLL